MSPNKTELTQWQWMAINRPHEHFCYYGGIATGKTFAGAHSAIQNIETVPDLTGMIGANTYDQLSQATLRELFYWLDEYKYDWMIDCKPPNIAKKFKTYKNILSVRSKRRPKLWTHAFTRIMSVPDALRGIEFSWYWLDETRDTPENTHDVVLSRMRESYTYRRGLLTTTTNGEDWSYKRFVRGLRKGQRLYGTMHVPTLRSVEAGIISPDFYKGLETTYSPLMAQQELEALHVNVAGGRAYYASGEANRKRVAPWGDRKPDPGRPLIVGCDFNYSPSPCVWMIGQIGPDAPDGMGGLWSDHIHWYGEIAKAEASTPEMANALVRFWPGYFYRIFGDSYGNISTTSNAGVHDYAQMNQVLTANRCGFMIDVDQSNPHVKDRVENMNRMAKNARGQTHMTYNPDTCPLLDGDMKVVGWKLTVGQRGRAKLDSGGDPLRTHASDGAGYAVWKLFPFVKHGHIGVSVSSPYAGLLRDAF